MVPAPMGETAQLSHNQPWSNDDDDDNDYDYDYYDDDGDGGDDDDTQLACAVR